MRKVSDLRRFAAKFAVSLHVQPTLRRLLYAILPIRGRGATMHSLLFRCPTSGHALDTGLDINIHRGGLQHVQPITLQVLCPLCGYRHVWKIADGWIREPQRGQPTGEWRQI
jgi:hypothetical protein